MHPIRIQTRSVELLRLQFGLHRGSKVLPTFRVIPGAIPITNRRGDIAHHRRERPLTLGSKSDTHSVIGERNRKEVVVGQTLWVEASDRPCYPSIDI